MKKFIILWLSQAVSQLGSAMTSFALVIWVCGAGGSAMDVSLLTFCSYMPYVAVSVFAGAFVDRHSKRTIMLASDTVAMLSTAVVFALILTNSLQIWHIYAVNTVRGLMDAFQSPASSVAVGMLVPEKQRGRAGGMISFSQGLVSIAAPVFAGFVSAFMGLKGVIFIDFATFVFAFVALAVFIKIPEKVDKTKRSEKYIKDVSSGFKYLSDHKNVLLLIISLAVMNLFSRITYENILPSMILTRSGGDETVWGIVSGFMGAGFVAGGAIVSLLNVKKHAVKTIYISAAISFITGDLLLGLSNTVWIWCVSGVISNTMIAFLNAGYMVAIYAAVPEEMQGRVFAARSALQYSTIPVGLLLGGFLADNVFEPWLAPSFGAGAGMAAMFVCTGVLGSATSLIWLASKKIRSLDRKKE